MQEIIVALTLGETPTAANEEERVFINAAAIDVAEIIALGGEVSIPPEWPDAS